MTKHRTIISEIGNTPLIKLKKISELTGCDIYGKAEFLNPGQSIKDRTALKIIEEAELRKDLTKGGLIVEGTAGNTGIGLSIVANAKGYKTKIIIPNTQSEEKKSTLRSYGAELIEVPAVPFSDDKNYQHVARRIAEEETKKTNNGVLFADQWNNLDNIKAHYEGTGPEIWNDTNGKLDGFVCSIGTGGTITGISNYLKEKNQNIKIAVADPHGASMYNYFKNNNVIASSGNSISEGIGLGRVTPIIKEAINIDFSYLIDDHIALPYIYDLVINEGIMLGGSSAINIAGAVELAKELGPGNTIVTILCDNGNRYQSKLFNPSYLIEKGISVPEWLT
ncbi:MAG: cysteine synthase A [Rhodobiaceae bacterium]|jgi:cysteine synthase|nr:cysteine synthase A [Rhodobiaceae bacterium]MBT6223552.1 cysteine synthase A [Rhodobiaceae bacterium]|tara:strand:+ start:2610 stop:3617 length:1008 start_codon:yes stop_codon:yes gene_type:complete